MSNTSENGENNGAGGVLRGPEGPKGAENTPPAFVQPGTSVPGLAGAGVNASGQVTKNFCNVSNDINPDISGVDIMKNKREQEALSYTAKDKTNQEVSNHTENDNDLDLENSIIDISNGSHDDFDNNEEPSFTSFTFETSVNPMDITCMNPNYKINVSYVKDAERKKDVGRNFSGAEKLKFKRLKREEERKEKEANETPEETTRRKHVESVYNVRNKSYAQAAKAAGGLMLEVRSHNQDYLLEQEDYDAIDFHCGLKFLELWEMGDKTTYKISGGLSQGGVWLACVNTATLTLVKDFVGTLTSPVELGGNYKVFGEDEKPFKYIQSWIPGKWWCVRDKLFGLITMSNRWLIEPLEDGQIPHFRISNGFTKMKSNDAGFFEITFEIDENLFPLIARNKGEFVLSLSTVKFFGSGMVTEAKRIIGEAYDNLLDGDSAR